MVRSGRPCLASVLQHLNPESVYSTSISAFFTSFYPLCYPGHNGDMEADPTVYKDMAPASVVDASKHFNS